MKKSAVAAFAAVAMVGTTGLAGAASVSGAAEGPSSTVTAQTQGTQTKRLVVRELSSRGLSRFTFAGAEKVRSRASGEVVGYDTFTGKFFPRQDKAVVRVALGLRNGIIVGRVVLRGNDSEFEGRILKGFGKYRGIDGTITGRTTNGLRTFVTLRYTL